MIQIRRSSERGHADHGWLKTWHTFSFSTYQDPRHMRFRALRVMNEDRIAPGQGFGRHPHHDMEIVTLVLSGALKHEDSMGNAEVLRAGEIQRMTAGRGITHSEFNASHAEEVHLYQIWITPERPSLEPGYEQKHFPASDRLNEWQLVVSRDGAEGSLLIHQDVRILLSDLKSSKSLTWHLPAGRHAWLQVLRGQITVGEEALSAGDGAAISNESSFTAVALAESELMLFDLA